jgi:hypothetical protein
LKDEAEAEEMREEEDEVEGTSRSEKKEVEKEGEDDEREEVGEYPPHEGSLWLEGESACSLGHEKREGRNSKSGSSEEWRI